jgi:transposase
VFPGSGPNAAKVFAGSALPPRSAAAAYHEAIVEKLGKRLTVQRIWQDLVEEYGYPGSYESVKRYVWRLPKRVRAVGVYHSAPGEEGQVDFFQGAPTLRPETGQWARPWVFRLTLCHSRHGYEEAAWDQKLETFLRLHENAFQDLGGVPRILRHDNLKAAVVRACLYDPDTNDVYMAFARHWGFTPLPIRPGTPRESGKEERSGGYVKSNALKGRRFDSLQEQNAFLRRWNRTVARLRIHGTTRQQVWTHFLQTDQPALQPLASGPFPYFESGTRTVHPDQHVEVMGSFYPVPLNLRAGSEVRVRWDRHLVRIYHQDTMVAVHARLAPGRWALRPGGSPLELTSTLSAWGEQLLGRCERVGPALRQWAEAAIAERGVRAYRLIQGVLRLTRTHPRERVLHAAARATEARLFRYKDLQRLAAATPPIQPELSLTQEHESIRPLNQYRLEDLL